MRLDQSIAGGVSARGVQRRVATGRWEAVHRGVYRIGGSPRSWHQDLLAACLAAGPGAVASHRAAAALWGLDGFRPGPIELSVVRSRFHRLGSTVVHRSTDLDPAAATRRLGIPVTVPARTLVDLGAVVRPLMVERALDDALSRRLVSLSQLRAALDSVARRGRRGAGVLRALLDVRADADERIESVLEARMLGLCRAASLPRPTCQHAVRVGGRVVATVDFAYPDRRIVVEVDGYEHHASLQAFGRDRTRQNDLVEGGWTVLRFTWRDVTQRPQAVVARLARVLVAHSNLGG